jgi:hypothetical protein
MTADVSTFLPELQMVCPFCRGKVEAGKCADGVMAVLHVMPTCETFDSCEVDEYLKRCRLRLSS